MGDIIEEGIFQKFLQISGTWQCHSLDVVQGGSPPWPVHGYTAQSVFSS